MARRSKNCLFMSELQKGTKDTLQNYGDLSVETTTSVESYYFINGAQYPISIYVVVHIRCNG